MNQQYNNPSNPAQQRAIAGVMGVEAMGVAMDTGNLAKAVLAVMRSVQYIEKKGRNDFHNYAYATEADVVAAIRKAMIENDLVLLPRMHFAPGSTTCVDEHGLTHIVVEYTLVHVPSGERAMITGIGSGSDKNKGGVGDKGIYKAITGAHKYLLLKTFMVETGDDPERAEELAVPPPPTRQPEPGREPPGEKRETFDDEPLPNGEDEDEGREDDDQPRDRVATDRDDPLSRYTKVELRQVIDHVDDRKRPKFKTPALGDEEGHPWAIVEEIFKQFVPTYETVDDLRGFYKMNMGVLGVMEREAPRRKKAVDKYFTTHKNSMNYRDKETN